MTHKDPKAKLIWTVTNSACKRMGAKSIADIIAKYHLNGVRMSYSSLARENLLDLREHLNQKIPSSRNQPSDGQIPFLLSFVGRRTIVCAPSGELDLEQGHSIDVLFLVDFMSCASHSIENSKSNDIEIRVSSEDQIKTLKEGSILNIAYGSIQLRIEKLLESSAHQRKVRCIVEEGGRIISGNDAHSTDMPRGLFPLLPEDAKTLECRFDHLADYVIVDGIQTKEEFFELKTTITGQHLLVSTRHPSVPITKNILELDAPLPPRFLFKIDSKKALEMTPDIMEHVDGIFLSRSELGIDEHPHALAILQKDLIHQCNSHSKTIIISSELMYSMRVNVNPTRAEVSDMANAAADGADALVLSHDVTDGPNAALVAEVSRNTLINSEAWEEKKWHPFQMDNIPSEEDAVTYGAIRIAEQSAVNAIVCFTEGGYTAMKLSSMRTPTDIIAITYNKRVMRQLNILRSVTAVVLESGLQIDKILQEARDILVTQFQFKKGDKFVFVSLTASSVSDRKSNIFTLQEIE